MFWYFYFIFRSSCLIRAALLLNWVLLSAILFSLNSFSITFWMSRYPVTLAFFISSVTVGRESLEMFSAYQRSLYRLHFEKSNWLNILFFITKELPMSQTDQKDPAKRGYTTIGALVSLWPKTLAQVYRVRWWGETKIRSTLVFLSCCLMESHSATPLAVMEQSMYFLL